MLTAITVPMIAVIFTKDKFNLKSQPRMESLSPSTRKKENSLDGRPPTASAMDYLQK